MRADDPMPRIIFLRNSGVSDPVIALRLVKEGWSRERVEKALGYRLVQTTPAPAVAESGLQDEREQQPLRYAPRVRRTNRRTWHVTTVAIGALAVLSFVFSGYVFSKPRPVYSYSLAVQSDASSTADLSFGMLPSLSDPNVYASTTAQLEAQKASFIDVDLSAMTLTVYENGLSVLEVPVAAKGRVGSWWETPTGIYKIDSKEQNHFSVMGGVNMPWSLDFDGNFFIHGWPTYPDGTPVSSSFSGGCIRLATADAEKVYDAAEVGEPVIVYDTATSSDSFSYELKAQAISAQSYLVADVKNGTVLASSNPATPMRIASITKLVTALTATEYINLDKQITVPDAAIIYTTKPRLYPGERVRAYDLLFIMLEESSNEAAETLASAVGRPFFVEKMNDTARSIGLTNTHFADPAGVGDNESTAEDLFSLLKYINENRTFVFAITAGKVSDSAYGQPAFTGIENYNQIPGAPATLEGGKVGETQAAKETYAGIFSVAIGNQPRDIAVIVLGSNDSIGDVRKLLSLVHSAYQPNEN